jgi:hypothetical protein
MRYVAASLVALTTTTPALAEIDVSASIGKNGITATLTTLESLSRPHTEAEVFAIGALHFLAGIEGALQRQWQTGMDQTLGDVGAELGIPLLRLPVPPNPTPQPFSGVLVSRLFADLDADMQAARTALDTLPPDKEFGLDISFSDIWFDVNMDGARDPSEGGLQILGPQLMGWQWVEPDPAAPPIVIRFDAADAAWLSAYTHVLSGLANTILAYDPAASIDRVIAAKAALKMPPPPMDSYDYDASFGQFADAFAMLEGAVNQPPDTARAKVAKEHFLAMIADNRRFWAAVAKETDNDREWIPNDHQTAALGFTLPMGTGRTWLVVLANGEALLQGRVLIPYWRGAEGQGINLGRMFDEPAPISITGWFQGWAAVPYLEKGPVIDSRSLQMFDALMGGNAGLMMVFLN